MCQELLGGQRGQIGGHVGLEFGEQDFEFGGAEALGPFAAVGDLDHRRAELCHLFQRCVEQRGDVGAVADAIALMGIVIALRFVEGIYRGALMGLQRQVFFNAFNALNATLRAAGAVAVLIWVSPTVASRLG